MPDPDFIVSPTIPSISVALEPSYNVFNSLLLLGWVDKSPGLNEWVTRTAAAMSPERRHTHRLILLGLYHAVVPTKSWPSFPAYVDHLAAQDPIVLRDRVLNVYTKMPKYVDGAPCLMPDPTDGQPAIDVAPLLESVDAFLEFLMERFPKAKIDVEIESEAHRYLNDPPAMQAMIVSYFRSMWEEVLAPEWERSVSMLQASVDAFRQLNLASMSKLEAVRLVLDRDLPEEKAEMWKQKLERAKRLVLVPSAHVGPYFGHFQSADTMWILFGARIPKGAQVHAPDLSRAEILVRISALSDDTRLRILKLVAEEGELRSSEIMARVELSQSAVSRHLKQLSATGYLSARRCEGAKCYVLNSARVEDTLRAISMYLLGK